jgi:hypothetical protein
MYSSLQGTITATYADLVRTFGEPDSDGDGDKTDVEWDLTFPSGVRAFLYNWKDGRNYCGESGLPIDAITNWHIGGTSIEAVVEVINALQESHV